MPRSSWSTFAGLAVLALALVSISASRIMSSRLHSRPLAPIAALGVLPQRVADWVAVASAEPAVSPVISDAFGNAQQVYDKVVSQVYVRPDGTHIQLMLAYKLTQQQEDRVHSPELCYYSQGFSLSGQRDLTVDAPNGRLNARAFLAAAPQRSETVVYWIRTGQTVSESALSSRLAIFRDGLGGVLDDGLLVRASVIEAPGSGQGAAMNEKYLTDFLANLLKASGGASRALLAGRVGA